MKRNVWSLEELSQILVAANEANANAETLLAGGLLNAEAAAIVQAYRQGFKAALMAVALATGVPTQVLGSAERWSEAEIGATWPKVAFVPPQR